MVSLEHGTHQNFKALHSAFEVHGRQNAEVKPPAVERDEQGRIWYDQLDSKVLPAAITLHSPTRSVFTKEGQAFLNGLERDERRRILSGALDRSLSGEYIQFWGTEGHIRKVDELPSSDQGWLKTIIGAVRNTNVPTNHDEAKLNAIQKTFQYKGALHGWEMAYIIDELHRAGENLNPAIQKLCGVDGFRVLAPLGGTHRDLYMPFLEGTTLEDFFDALYEFDKPLAKLTLTPLHEYTGKVRRAMFMSMVMMFDTLGYQPHNHEIYKYQYLDGYDHYVRVEGDGKATFLDVFIDMHPMGVHPYDRYRNLMLSPELTARCWQIAQDSLSDSDKVEQIASLMNDNAIIFDPIYIRQRRVGKRFYGR